MANGPPCPITQDSSCHDQHTMPRKPIVISHDQFRIVVFAWMCVCVAVAESVRTGSVAVVSGIYYGDHWWQTGLPIRPTPAACRISTASLILLCPSLITVFRVVPTLVRHENGSQSSLAGMEVGQSTWCWSWPPFQVLTTLYIELSLPKPFVLATISIAIYY